MENQTPFSNQTQWMFTALKSAGYQTQKFFKERGIESIRWIKGNMSDGQFLHLAFCVKSQCFGIWILPVNDMGTLVQKDEIERFVNTCTKYSIVPCFIKLKWDDFSPVNDYIFTDPFTNGPLNPIEKIIDGPVPMSKWELHNYSVEFSAYALRDKGYKVVSANDSLNVLPQLILDVNGELQFVIVDTKIVKRIDGIDELTLLKQSENNVFDFDKSKYPQFAGRTVYIMRIYVLADNSDGDVFRKETHLTGNSDLYKC